jgi:hypothetical protein
MMKRGRKQRFSRVRMIQLALQGLKQREIAEKLGCTQATVCRGLKQLYISGWPERKDRPMGINVHTRRKFVTPFVLMFHDKGYNMTEIGEEVESATMTVRSILLEHDRDTSQRRGMAIAIHKRHCDEADKLADFLEGYGPQTMDALKLQPNLRRHLKSDDRFTALRFLIKIGRSGVERPVSRIANGRCPVSINALAAAGDPRIPVWLAAYVPWRLRGSGEAGAMMRRLRDHIGREHAATIIELLGHEYMNSPVSGIYTNTQWRDMIQALAVVVEEE